MSLKTVLPPLFLLLAAGCGVGYRYDSGFQSWLQTTENQCAQLYGELPAMSQSEREAFMKLTYATYDGRTQPIMFANELGVRYPNNLLIVDCLANAFPSRPR